MEENINYLFQKKKKGREQLLKKFHQQKEDKEYNIKKDISVRLLQKVSRR